ACYEFLSCTGAVSVKALDAVNDVIAKRKFRLEIVVERNLGQAAAIAGHPHAVRNMVQREARVFLDAGEAVIEGVSRTVADKYLDDAGRQDQAENQRDHQFHESDAPLPALFCRMREVHAHKAVVKVKAMSSSSWPSAHCTVIVNSLPTGTTRPVLEGMRQASALRQVAMSCCATLPSTAAASQAGGGSWKATV